MNQDYFIAVTLLGVSLLVNAYLLYGKIKRKPLIGNYKPGSADYAVFLKLIQKPKYLIISIGITILLIAHLIFSIQEALKTPQANLITAPSMVVIGLGLLLAVMSSIYDKHK